jgi:hypothetical protein
VKYGIWLAFSPDARRVAATATYRRIGRGTRRRTTPEGCCPLGLAMRADGHGWPTCPAAGTVATSLTPNIDATHDEYQRTYLAAAAWMAEWDTGRIDPPELAALLEVEG